MTSYSDLSTILLPLIDYSKPNSVLLVGEIARLAYIEQHNTRSQLLTTPFKLQQLNEMQPVDLAIISELTESLSKEQAIAWLGLLRNSRAQHIIVIANVAPSFSPTWYLADYLSMGMKHIASTEQYQVYSYALASYQSKREWLNSRFWANPENYDKYRW